MHLSSESDIYVEPEQKQEAVVKAWAIFLQFSLLKEKNERLSERR